MSTTHLVDVPGGRKVAVESYGDPAGKPVFFFHGWPSSRYQGALAEPAARSLGIRFLSVDRPGVGQSDLHIGRKLTEWPSVLGALADHFEIERFHVVGVSGGGPYALVSAWGLPERVIAAAAVSSAPPLADRDDTSRLLPVYQMLLYLYRRHPESVRILFRLGRPLITVRPPKWLWRMFLKTVPASDQKGFEEIGVFDRAWAGYSTAWVGHPDGVFHDAKVYAEPWGFNLSDIRVPVRIWHGRDDHNFHWQLAEELAAAVPTSTFRILEGEGHYSLIIRHHPQVLLDLISDAAKG